MEIPNFKSRLDVELSNILQFWMDNSIDENFGGFIAQMNPDKTRDKKAKKGSVLNARILWTFAAAYNFTNQSKYLKVADRAFDYFYKYFVDHEYGGCFWLLNEDGTPYNKRKQIYALAFAIYGISEYGRATGNEKAFALAYQLYDDIERYSYDAKTGGYKEAFDHKWEELDDLRLSPKDRNDPKTMNTHLHIIEAYANLYKHKPNEGLKNQIAKLLTVFEDKIIDPKTNHLHLFFNNDWVKQSEAISYGHDIEASWLLLECAEIIKDKDLILKWKNIAIRMCDATLEGFKMDGSLIHEYDPVSKHKDDHREWWVSAEAMVGFYNGYQITGNKKYLAKVFDLWSFIEKHLIDHGNGEWFWGVNSDYSKMNEDKIGPWKCPYHNARACMEILKRLESSVI